VPLTSELDNLKKLESVGFSHEQAETLADVIEKSHVDSQESLKEFIRNENTKLENKLSNKFNALDDKLSNRINSLDDKLSNRINGLDDKLSNRINGLDKEISSLRVEISKELKDLLIKIFGIVVGTVGIAVTILKLFP
jgi:archaellum component FlaC